MRQAHRLKTQQQTLKLFDMPFYSKLATISDERISREPYAPQANPPRETYTVPRFNMLVQWTTILKKPNLQHILQLANM